MAATTSLFALTFLFKKVRRAILSKLDRAIIKVNLLGAKLALASAKKKKTEKDSPAIISIDLPNQKETVNRVGLDIGGSLVKVVYFVPNQKKKPNETSQEILGGKLHFVKFEVSRIDDCVSFLKSKLRVFIYYYLIIHRQ